MNIYNYFFDFIKIPFFIFIAMIIFNINGSTKEETISSTQEKKAEIIRKINEESEKFVQAYTPEIGYKLYNPRNDKTLIFPVLIGWLSLGSFTAKGMLGDYNPKASYALSTIGKATAFSVVIPLIAKLVSNKIHSISRTLYEHPLLSTFFSRTADVIDIVTINGFSIFLLPLLY